MRLIDGDALYKRLHARRKISSGNACKAYENAIDDVCDAPTIDPAAIQQSMSDAQVGGANMDHIANLLMNNIRRSLKNLQDAGVGYIDLEVMGAFYYSINDKHYRITITETPNYVPSKLADGNGA